MKELRRARRIRPEDRSTGESDPYARADQQATAGTTRSTPPANPPGCGVGREGSEIDGQGTLGKVKASSVGRSPLATLATVATRLTEDAVTGQASLAAGAANRLVGRESTVADLEVTARYVDAPARSRAPVATGSAGPAGAIRTRFHCELITARPAAPACSAMNDVVTDEVVIEDQAPRCQIDPAATTVFPVSGIPARDVGPARLSIGASAP